MIQGIILKNFMKESDNDQISKNTAAVLRTYLVLLVNGTELFFKKSQCQFFGSIFYI